MIQSATTILVSLGLLVGTLTAVGHLGPRAGLPAEAQRKLIHVGLGLFALTFPWIFRTPWEVAVLCLLIVAVLTIVRQVPVLRDRLGGGLFAVQRFSLGETFFAMSVALIFFLSHGRPVVLYLLPILILALCDAAAALVGTSYGRRVFIVEEGRKSWEGCSVFFMTAWLVSLIGLLLWSDVPRQEAVTISLMVGLIGALIEATSWKGLDNLFLPLGLYLLLHRTIGLANPRLLELVATFLVLLLAALWMARRFGQDLHAINTMVTAGLFVWLASEWAALPAPFSVFVAYLFLTLKDESAVKRAETLVVVLSIIAIALFWFVVREAFGYNTYFVFDTSYGVLLVMTLLPRAMERFRWLLVLPVLLVGWLAANVRILLVTDYAPRDLALSAAVLILVAAGGWLSLVLRRRMEAFLWWKRAFLSVAVASIGIPLTVAL